MPETVTPFTLNDLTTAFARDTRLGTEVLNKLIQFANGTGDVTFNLDTPVVIPSISKMQQMMQMQGLDDIQRRLYTAEKLGIALVQGLNTLADKSGSPLISPSYKALDLNATNKNGRTTDPLWRANVSDGSIRMPYEAFVEVVTDRRYDTQGAKLGGVLMPTYTENVALEKRYSVAPAVANVVNVSAYPAFTRTITKQTTQYYYYYYGYYYYWWYYSYGWAVGSYTSTTTATVTENLNGSSLAQTFQVSANRVLVGVDAEVLNPGGTKSAAVPKVMLCESEQGTPMLNKVIVSGNLVDNANAANTSTTATTSVQYAFTKPVMLQPGKSYSLVFTASNTWNIGYTTGPAQDSSGGVFYTQDGQYWSSDLQKDLCYALRIADFGASTTSFTLELSPLSLSGGIGSLNLVKKVDAPVNGDVTFEIDINNNGNWSPLAVVQDVQSLPAFCPVRAKFTGSQYAMPLLDTQISKIVAFRPATALRYISTDRTFTSTTLTVAYTLYGYDTSDPTEPMHVFSPRLKLVDGPQTIIQPTTISRDSVADNKQTIIKATFIVPAATTTTSAATIYRHDDVGTTRSANTLFDISSIVEMF